jgi:predicted phage-related endonuclease
MHVTGIHKVYFAVLINGCDYLERIVTYDPQYCEELEAASLKLWQCICNKTPPELTQAEREALVQASNELENS